MRMKPTVKLLVWVLAAGSAWAQNPSIIQNTRNTMNAVSSTSTAASDEALGVQESAPSSKRHAHVAAKTAAVPAKAQPAKTAAPAKAQVTVSTKAAVAAPVKTPVTAPVKVKAVSANTSAHSSATPFAKSATPASGHAVVAPAKVSVVTVKNKSEAKKAPAIAIAGAPKAAILAKDKPKAQIKDKEKEKEPPAQKEAVKAPPARGPDEGENSLAPDPKYAANGRRDPFISPVVSHANNSSCSSGKKCLEIGTINLRGVVHGESGFIAVVSNGLNKAYFLRENDPVFNGYVMKITGDSIVFQETLQDRLGKSFTREVVKKITTPAV
jgi:hypothetical protein